MEERTIIESKLEKFPAVINFIGVAVWEGMAILFLLPSIGAGLNNESGLFLIISLLFWLASCLKLYYAIRFGSVTPNG